MREKAHRKIGGLFFCGDIRNGLVRVNKRNISLKAFQFCSLNG